MTALDSRLTSPPVPRTPPRAVNEARRQAELQSLRADVEVGLDQIAAGNAKPFGVSRIVKAGEQFAAKSR